MLKIVLSLFVMLAAGAAFAEAELGQPAPDFTLKGHDGKTYSLADFKKNKEYVILEWFNKDCPYVRKHYDADKNMQATQKALTSDKKVKWLSVISAAEGKEFSEKELAEQYKKEGMASTALTMDKGGTIGKAYGAKTTPHMFIINPEGNVVYKGAIDSNPSSNPKDIAGATNYVKTAWTELNDPKNKTKKLTSASTKPYGCSVKY